MLEGWLGGAALVGIAAAFWEQIKTFGRRIVGLLFITVKIDGHAAKAVVAYCWQNYRRTGLGERMFKSSYEQIKSVKRVQLIGYEALAHQPVIFWNGWKPILIGTPKQSGNDAPASPGSDGGIKITHIRGLLDIDVLITNALVSFNHKWAASDAANDKKRKDLKKRFRVIRLTGSGPVIAQRGGGRPSAETDISAPSASSGQGTLGGTTWLGDIRLLQWKQEDLGVDVCINDSAFEVLAFPPKISELIQEIVKWRESEAWYRKKSIPWRRGFLLFGKPGTGKTSLVRAIAYDLDLLVFTLDLSTMSNNDLINAWQNVRNNVPCIALMEDIDAVFCGRENKLGEMGGV